MYLVIWIKPCFVLLFFCHPWEFEVDRFQKMLTEVALTLVTLQNRTVSLNQAFNVGSCFVVWWDQFLWNVLRQKIKPEDVEKKQKWKCVT